MRTSNPALSEKTFENYARAGHFDGVANDAGSARVMTVEGTVNKTLILLMLTIAAASYTWSQLLNPGGNPGFAGPLAIGGAIGGFIVALVTIFKPSASPITAPVYAVLEGLFLGAISAAFNRAYPGIVPQAVALTFGTLFVLLTAYRTGFIRATESFKRGVVAATGAVMLVFVVHLVLRLFGSSLPFVWGGGLFGIGFSLVVVVIAALNLVLDFDLIEQGARHRAPKFMEWYGGFSLLVTLVWLYLEILRLLSKLASSRD